MTLKQFLTWPLLSIIGLYAIIDQLRNKFRFWYYNETPITYNWEDGILLIIKYLILIIIACTIFSIVKYLNKKIPWSSKTVFLRSLLEIQIFTIVNNLILIGFNQLILYLKLGVFFQLKDIILICSTGTIINFILVPIVELTITYHDKLQAELNAKQLQIKTVKYEYDLLKSQINPHFIFNNLSVLSSLIIVNQSEAKKFTNSFSNVLRHVLDYLETDNISLEEEIEFTEQYIYLLKVRYNENLTVNLRFEKEHLDRKVIPMAIQMLLENVIKHNEVSDKNPMSIDIQSNNFGISVSNQIKLKTSVSSWGIGLSNIKNRYATFDQKILIDEKENLFTVSIPYLK